MKRNSVIIGVAAASLLASASLVMGESDAGRYNWWSRSGSSLEAVPQGLYSDECGSCHYPYQAGLLPARSWEAILARLDDHFGDNAELSGEDLQAVRDYLLTNAADRNDYRISGKIVRSEPTGATPLRITETRFFRRKHHEVPRRLVTGNPKVGSFSNCNACHREAADGSFAESGVRIAGYGRWDH